jgi:hypothetical protein
MAEKRGAVMLLTAGDPAIYGAIADGILTARAMMPVRDESPETAIIRKRTAETLRRIDMRCRPKEADEDDIETRILKARETYGTEYRPSFMRSIGGKLLGMYGLAILKAHDFFDFEDARWKG